MISTGTPACWRRLPYNSPSLQRALLLRSSAPRNVKPAGATRSQEETNGTPGHFTHDKGATKTMTMTMTMTMTTREPFICGQPYKPLLL